MVARQQEAVTMVMARRLVIRLGGAFGAFTLWPRMAASQTEPNPNVNAQLLVAGRNKDAAAVQRALARGAAPDSRNRLGKTVLLMACERSDEPLARTMLEAG